MASWEKNRGFEQRKQDKAFFKSANPDFMSEPGVDKNLTRLPPGKIRKELEFDHPEPEAQTVGLDSLKGKARVYEEEDNFFRKIDSDSVRQAMEAMLFDPLFKEIINLKLQNYKLSEIAELTAAGSRQTRKSGAPLSMERIRQIESIAVRKLRHYFEFKKSKPVIKKGINLSPDELFLVSERLIENRRGLLLERGLALPHSVLGGWIRSALMTDALVTHEEREVLKAMFIKKQTADQIAKNMHLSRSIVLDLTNVAYKGIKNSLKEKLKDYKPS